MVKSVPAKPHMFATKRVMKKIIFISFFFFLYLSGFSQPTSKKLIASCCSGKEGRCTGSASCRACTNCSRCAHCGNGGSCGVCSSSSNTYYSAPKTYKKKRKSSSYSSGNNYSPSEPATYSEGESLSVTINNVNLREGPGTEYEILTTISKNTIVILKDKEGDWAKVEVYGTGTVGYVNIKYLK